MRLRTRLWIVGALTIPNIAAAEDPSLPSILTEIVTRADAYGPGFTLRRLDITESGVVLGVELPTSVHLADLPTRWENRYEEVVGAVAALRPDLAGVHLLVAHPGEPLRPPPRPVRLPNPVPRPNPGPSPVLLNASSFDTERFPFGQTLAGKTIVLSPGHGHIYFDSLGRYSTQRAVQKFEGCGRCRGIIEDFGTHELAIRHLVPLLEGAGAKVVLLRERGYTTEVSHVDDGDMGYAETGPFSDGISAGGHDGDYRFSTDPNAQVAFQLTAPQSGQQLLSLWFVSGTNRLGNALVEVDDGFGTRHFPLDLRTHGRRWVSVGNLYLEAGDPLTVRLKTPTSLEGGPVLVADAARLGAGRHDTDHPWWSMGALPFALQQYAPMDVIANSDVMVRPTYAEWYGADAYVSLHSNASGLDGSGASGTVTYRYNCGAFPTNSSDPPAADCDDPTGSDRLQALVHDGLVSTLQDRWDPEWIDRGTRVANFGEVRGLDSMPGILVESAFHDNLSVAEDNRQRMPDNQALHDPRWRRSAAYGIYQGLSRFFAPEGALLLEPPEGLTARRVAPGSVQLTFAPVAGARGYRVYTAIDGRRFDRGRLITEPVLRVSNLPEDAVTAFRVATVNEAGEGRPSATVTARAARRPSTVLIIDAFQREDAWVQERDNRRDTLLTHGLALRGVEHGFDSATEAAWATGHVTLEGYAALILALGRESTEHGILTPALRAELATAVDNGLAVFADGSEIGWALDARGNDDTRAWLDRVFGVALAADDAASDHVLAVPGGWLAEALPPSELSLADEDRGLMTTQYPDAFTARPEAVAELAYGSNAAAAVRFDQNLIVGVALENIVAASHRAALLAGWLGHAVPLTPLDPPDAGIPPPRDGGTISEDATVSLPSDAGNPDAGIASPSQNTPPRETGCGCQAFRPTHSSKGFPTILVFLLLCRWGLKRFAHEGS